MTRRLRLLASVGLVAAGTVTLALVWADRDVDSPKPVTAAGKDPTATVMVPASVDLGPLNNPADYHNQSGPAWPLGPADLERVDAFTPKVVRAWFKPHQYYDHGSKEFQFDYRTANGTTTYDYLDQVAAHSQTIIGNFDQCDPELMRLSAPAECRSVLKAGLRHYKERYGSLRYIELFNEPDKTWEPSEVERPAIPLDEYYRWYKIGYEVVREVNEELRPEIPLEIGGPSAYTFNKAFLTGFLDLYRADGNPEKKLDFISYHQYRQRARPADVGAERSVVRQWLVDRDLNPDRPVFVTEYGVFPGPNVGTTFEADLLTQAAAMATLGRYYTYSGMDMALHWTYDHLDNERKSMLVDAVDGAVYPYYNLVLMQRMLRTRLLPADSTAVDEAGIGVSATATGDRDGIAVLVTNYQWTDGQQTYDVRLRIADLPAGLANRTVVVERHLIDAKTSNWSSDHNSAALQRVERNEISVGQDVETDFHLGVNAMTLVVVRPVGRTGNR